jgi:hypothetical protein
VGCIKGVAAVCLGQARHATSTPLSPARTGEVYLWSPSRQMRYGKDKQRLVRLPLEEKQLAVTALILIIVLYLWRLWLLKTVEFNPDEFWHLHSAWCLSTGLIPYRDFFEHHTPWLYFLLAPIFRFYRVDVDPNAAVAFIFLARRIMILCAATALALTFVLGRLLRCERVAWLSTALLSTTVVFAHKTLEIRPDVPAMVLWLGCLVTLLKAIDARGITERKERCLFILSGFFIGGAVMTAQKILVVMPGLGLAMLWYLAAGEGRARKRLLNCVRQLIGFSVPIIGTLMFFWAHGAFWTFIKYNLMNAAWKTRWPVYLLIRHVIAQNPILVVLGSLGLVREAFHRQRSPREALFFLITAGAITGVFALPTPWLQNYLIFLPLLALSAGDFLVFITDWIFTSDAAVNRLTGRLAITFAFGLVASGAVVLLSDPSSLWVHLTFGMFLLTGTTLLLRFPGTALALLLIAFSVHPVYHMRKELSSANALQLKRLRYVLANSLPSDTVMDGWSGLGVFRRSAWFYPFIHGEIEPLLSPSDRKQLLLGLQLGKIAPKFVFPNEAMLSISDPVTVFLLTHYEPVDGDPYLRRRSTASTHHRPLSPRSRVPVSAGLSCF